MIKRPVNLLLLVTAVFTAFTLGFFAGRNYNAAPVQVANLRSAEATESNSLVLQAPQTVPAESNTAQTETFTAESKPESPQTEPSDTAATESTHPAPAPETAPPKDPAPQSPPPTTEPESSAAETEPPATEPEPETTESTKSGLININTASAAELMTLPGIGEVLSQRIVAYRTANGPFRSVAALTNVSGIGEKRLAAIIHLITV